MGESYEKYHGITPPSEHALDSQSSLNSIISNQRVKMSTSTHQPDYPGESVISVISSAQIDQGSYIDITYEIKERPSIKHRLSKSFICCKERCMIL